MIAMQEGNMSVEWAVSISTTCTKRGSNINVEGKTQHLPLIRLVLVLFEAMNHD